MHKSKRCTGYDYVNAKTMHEAYCGAKTTETSHLLGNIDCKKCLDNFFDDERKLLKTAFQEYRKKQIKVSQIADRIREMG
jgi:hypothetical protein